MLWLFLTSGAQLWPTCLHIESAHEVTRVTNGNDSHGTEESSTSPEKTWKPLIYGKTSNHRSECQILSLHRSGHSSHCSGDRFGSIWSVQQTDGSFVWMSPLCRPCWIDLTLSSSWLPWRCWQRRQGLRERLLSSAGCDLNQKTRPLSVPSGNIVMISPKKPFLSLG